MKIKKVYRYWCDFCKKSSGQKHAMEIHELHCTMNPNRKCRMCARRGNKQVNLDELIILFPKYETYRVESSFYLESYPGLNDALKETILKVRRRVGDCPACILAAIRQSKTPMYLFDSDVFDYKLEIEKFWKLENDNKYDAL